MNVKEAVIKTALNKMQMYIGRSEPWGTNRAALIAVLQSAMVANKPNIDDVYTSYVAKLTKKNCKKMPNFIGKLRKSGLVSFGPNKLQWEAKLTAPKEQLKELWDMISKD
jgi:hypothetical protein